MHIQTPFRSLPATAGSHVQRAILSQAPRMKRHISSRARIGLRGGERVGIGTASTTVALSFNSNARSSSQVKVLDGHHASGRCANRLHSHVLWTHVPLTLVRFKLFASDQDGRLRTTRAQAPVQSAWSGDVGDGRNRYMRKRARALIGEAEKSFCRTPYCVCGGVHKHPYNRGLDLTLFPPY